MAREEEDDPFGSAITKFCQPISSDELKLQDCRMHGESESSPSVASDSEFERTPLTHNLSQVTGIFIVSPPETDSDEENSSIDKITLLENDEFHTPPEHHNRRSSSSSQEFISPRERPASEAVIEDKIHQSSCVDEGIQLEVGENLGLPVTSELNGSDGALESHCSQNLTHVDKVTGFEAKLKRYKVLRDELGEKMSKKIRVSKENQDCDALSTSETGIEDQVHCTKRSKFNKGKLTVHGSSSSKDFGGISANGGLSVEAAQKSSQYVGSYTDPEQRMEENTVEEDRVEPYSMDSLKDVKNEGITVTHVNSTAMDLEDNCGISTEERLDKKAFEEHRVENEPGNPKVKKRSWQELMNAFEVYFKMDQSLKDVDFLETAKRRGHTFPQP